MKLILAVAGILIFAAPLMAETYSWEDEKGTVNFTENYTSIPAKYRKKARKLGDMGSDTSSAPPAAISGAKETAAARVNAGTGASPSGEASGLFNGRKPEAWQQEMRPLYAEVKRLEQQLVELESLIRKPAGISKSRADGLPQEFRETQRLYNQALKQYNSMNDDANTVGLPAEFRK
jgi:Domain of unknown function (DUF4124)